MAAARRPSTKVGRPVGPVPAHGGVDVGDEGVEAVLVALRMAGREHRISLRLFGLGVGAAGQYQVLASPTHSVLGGFLVEGVRRVVAVQGEPQPVLAAR